jgi:hypothetical protein
VFADGSISSVMRDSVTYFALCTKCEPIVS